MQSHTQALSGRLPDFFIVGHQKCGTTAMYLLLQQHPRVFMSTPKEPRYFAFDLRSPKVEEMRDSRTRPHKLEHYLALFADARPDQLAGEASAWYLRSSVAADEIAKVQPDARIIAILREPASYLRSFHLQMLHSHQETQTDFRKAIALEPSRREGKRIPRTAPSPLALFYSDHVKYVDQLRRYHAVFPRDRVLVLIYDDFRADNEATVRGCFRFLGLDDDVSLGAVETQRLSGVRLMWLRKLMRASRLASRDALHAGRGGKAMNALLPNRVLNSPAFRRAIRRTVSHQPAPPDEAYMRELRRRFKPEVVALSEYLGRDLVSLWGYDQLD